MKHEIGRYLRVRRDALGLSPEVVANKVGISTGYLGRVERGTQQVALETLSRLFDALDVEAAMREHLVKLAHPTLLEAARGRRAYGLADPHDLIDLEASPYPHALMRWPLFDVVACNEAYESALPGLTAGGNAIEWALLDPRAPLVLPNWLEFAHGLVHSMRFLPKFKGDTAERFDEIIARCSTHPRWEQFWNTYPPDRGPNNDIVVLRKPFSGQETQYIIRIDRPEFPANTWYRYRFIPYPVRKIAAA